jgi:hypothetical protein
MRYLAIPIVVTLIGCAPAPIIVHQPPASPVGRQIEHSNLHRFAFCNGKELTSYFELPAHVLFTCEGGKHFMLPK